MENNNLEQDRKAEVVDIDPSTLPEIESEREDLIDYEKHRLKPAKIESMEIVRIPSKFAKSEDGKQHKLKIVGEVVESVEKKSDDEDKAIDIRPTALIGMIEDADGNLKGYPNSEDSGWGKLKKAIGNISEPKDIIGKALPMRINETRTGKFLGFMY